MKGSALTLDARNDCDRGILSLQDRALFNVNLEVRRERVCLVQSRRLAHEANSLQLIAELDPILVGASISVDHISLEKL